MEQQRQEPLVLASTSPYRARLLSRLHLPFTTAAPEVDESPIEGESGPALAKRLASAKAQATDHQHGVIIGSDQVAVCRGQLLGKPGNADRACEQLGFCQGHPVTFYTGVTVWRPAQGQLLEHVEPFSVDMRRLTAREIEDYVTIEQPLDCAGSFKWEALGITLFDAMHGEDPTALEGLPLIALCRLLRSLGWALPPRA